MKAPRMTLWLVASVILLALQYLTMPADPLDAGSWSRFLVVVNKVNLITLGGWMGYWLDRHGFPYARPDTFLPFTLTELTLAQAVLVIGYMIRRAIIMGACMLAVGMGT